MAGDQAVENAARRLQELADRFAGESGIKGKLAQPLADDAEFIRKMKPSLIKARAKGELPTDETPGHGRTAPAGPQLGKRPAPSKARRGGGANPYLVVAAALAAGVLLAKVIDWRGHAHPRE
jgi:hypothetical protein